LKAIDSSSTRLSVQYCQDRKRAGVLAAEQRPMILMIGTQVFGYSDQPLSRTADNSRKSCTDQNLTTYTLSVTLANSVLLSAPPLTLTTLFDHGSYTAHLSLMQTGTLTPASQSDRLVLLKASKDSAEFLLYGNRLSGSISVEPDVTLQTLPGEGSDGLRLVTLTSKQIDAYKFLILSRQNESPEAISIPSVTLPTSSAGTLTADRVDLQSNTATFTGKGLDDLQKVTYENHEIKFAVAKGGQSVTLRGLKAAGVTSVAAVRTLQFLFKAQPVSVRIDVVDRKVETVGR
jgi:hypothetical protein